MRPIACPTVLTANGDGCTDNSDNILTAHLSRGLQLRRLAGNMGRRSDSHGGCWEQHSVAESSRQSTARAITSITRTYNGTIGNSPTTRTNGLQTRTVSLDTTTAYGWDYSVSGGYTRTYTGTGTATLAINGIRLVAAEGATPAGTTLWDHSVSTATSTTSASANALQVINLRRRQERNPDRERDGHRSAQSGEIRRLGGFHQRPSLVWLLLPHGRLNSDDVQRRG